MHRFNLLLLLSVMLLQSCIKDDIVLDSVEPELRITSMIETLEINSTHQFESTYLNNVGIEEEVELVWTSTDESIITITPAGFAEALSAGSVRLIVSYVEDGINLFDEITVVVGETTTVTNTVLTGQIRTTSSYVLQGGFTVEQVDDDVVISIDDSYRASSSLPGLYVYLSNNQSTVANALELARVRTFSGQHQYVVQNINMNDFRYLVYFCKPFNVKVGDGEIQ